MYRTSSRDFCVKKFIGLIVSWFAGLLENQRLGYSEQERVIIFMLGGNKASTMFCENRNKGVVEIQRT